MSVLKVILLEAENVPKMDVGGWADPFCFLQMAGQKEIMRSKTINNTKHPIWDERFQFRVANKQHDVLHILMKDHDSLSADDEISKLEIPLAPLNIGQPVLHWFPMTPVPGVDARDIRLRMILELTNQ